MGFIHKQKNYVTWIPYVITQPRTCFKYNCMFHQFNYIKLCVCVRACVRASLIMRERSEIAEIVEIAQVHGSKTYRKIGIYL